MKHIELARPVLEEREAEGGDEADAAAARRAGCRSAWVSVMAFRLRRNED